MEGPERLHARRGQGFEADSLSRPPSWLWGFAWLRYQTHARAGTRTPKLDG